jgi:8-oxo-dGTP pyrophosphatase MutT (NUDIX family)
MSNKSQFPLFSKNSAPLHFRPKEVEPAEEIALPLGVSLRAFIRDRQRLLLVKSKSEAEGVFNFWEVPGGEIRVGEEPKEALRRRLEEELGIPPSSLAVHFPLLVSSFFDQRERFIIFIGWHCTLLPGTKIVPAPQIEDWRWLTQEMLKDLPLGKLKELLSLSYWQQAQALGIDPKTGLTADLENFREEWPKR